MEDYFRDFVREEARSLGVTVEQVRDWQPPAKGSRAGREAHEDKRMFSRGDAEPQRKSPPD
jgi:hypothetical protein